MTLVESSKNFFVKLGRLIRVIGKEIQPDYWVCTYCGNVEYCEQDVMCLECGIGEMIYKGDVG